MKTLITAIVLASAAASSQAGTIVNGDFSNDFAGWTVAGDVINTQNQALLTAFGQISQNQTWTAGEQLSFDWFFQGMDYYPFNDWSVFQVQDALGNIISDFTLADVASVETYGDSGWQTFHYTFNNAGSGSINFAVYNDIDDNYSSLLMVDNVKSASVPEPTSLLIMGLGLFGLGFSRKRAAK